MSAFRYLVWVQTEKPETRLTCPKCNGWIDNSVTSDGKNNCANCKHRWAPSNVFSTKIEEKTDSLDEARRRARVWAARERVLSARVWDSLESVWTYDAFEEFDA